MQYELARMELQSPPQSIFFSGMFVEALVMLGVTSILVWLI